jgi:hypothetical protein
MAGILGAARANSMLVTRTVVIAVRLSIGLCVVRHHRGEEEFPPISGILALAELFS